MRLPRWHRSRCVSVIALAVLWCLITVVAEVCDITFCTVLRAFMREFRPSLPRFPLCIVLQVAVVEATAASHAPPHFQLHPSRRMSRRPRCSMRVVQCTCAGGSQGSRVSRGRTMGSSGSSRHVMASRTAAATVVEIATAWAWNRCAIVEDMTATTMLTILARHRRRLRSHLRGHRDRRRPQQGQVQGSGQVI